VEDWPVAVTISDMTRAMWLRMAAATAVGVLSLIGADLLVRDHPIGVSASATSPAVDQPIADTPPDAATATTDDTTSTIPDTVPPTTMSVDTTVLTPTPTSPSVSPATTAVAVSEPAPGDSIGVQALRLIQYPWAKLGYQIAFHGPRDGFFGLTDCRLHRIDIYVAPGQSVAQVAYVTAFEIGHAIDCSLVTNGHEAEWTILRNFNVRGSWFPSCSCSEDNFGSGDFSEVFARWQVGPIYPWRSTLAPAPTAAQLADLVPLFG